MVAKSNYSSLLFCVIACLMISCTKTDTDKLLLPHHCSGEFDRTFYQFCRIRSQVWLIPMQYNQNPTFLSKYQHLQELRMF